MIGNVVARRYARAIFALGRQKGLEELERYGKDLATVAGVLKESPELLRVFKNPLFGVEEKKAVLVKILEKAKASPVAGNFMKLLADKERLGVLPEIEAHYADLLDAEKGVIRGELLTAVKLDASKQKEVKASLEKQAGKELILEFATDPEILGGVVLKVGDRVLDASIRAQLEMLKENIKRGE